MKKIYLIPVLILILSCANMKNSSKNSNEKTGLYTTLLISDIYGRENEMNLIINNQTELEDLYYSVNSQEVPKVDFSTNQVIALFLGTKNTGGFSISVNRVEEESGKLVVYKKVESPKGMATMALTNPFVIVEIHSKKEIIFR